MGVMGNTNINLDDDLKKKAKELRINISALATKALKQKLGQSLEVSDEDVECFSCGRKQEKASRDNDFIGMIWLVSEERWCCPGCLKFEVRKVLIGVTG